jgi:DNA-binding HxlR family transcriptional regulator
VPYQEASQRQRSEHRLTQKGLDLYPILVALNEWGTASPILINGLPQRWLSLGAARVGAS